MKKRLMAALLLCIGFTWGASAGIIDGLGWPTTDSEESSEADSKSSKPVPIRI